MKNKTILCYCSTALLMLVFCKQSSAQVNNFATGYFQNQYLFNPAMSGHNAKEGTIGAGYRKYGNVKDGPSSIYLTGEYAFNETMGAGINVVYDRAGLINTTKIMGSYSYHVQLDGESKRLHFGISAGGVQPRLNNKDVYGDLDDPAIYNFNNQFMRFEADFGIAYTDGKLTIQGAVPNLVSTFRKDETSIANRSVYFAAASYKINLSDDEQGWDIEPKIAYRGIKGNKSIADAGAAVSYNDLINVFALYHTNKSVSAGVGLKLAGIGQLTAAYSTQAAEFKTYSGGDFELGLIFLLK